MDKTFITEMDKKLKQMRAKVINAKGEGVKGLSKISFDKEKSSYKTPKNREAKE